MRICLLLCVLIVAFFELSCSRNKRFAEPEYPGTAVNLGTHQLMAYTVSRKSKYLVVFESGLGNDHTAWYSTGKSLEIVTIADYLGSDVLLYDRAGYGKSGTNTELRNINKLSTELEKVVAKFADGRKVVLVGHSLGGLIIRDYAIRNPGKVAALLFVDAANENYNHYSTEQIAAFYRDYSYAYGANSGIALETLQLIEDFKYMVGLPHLPDVPVIAITSMKIDAQNDAAAKQRWYNANESLRVGLTDFTHVTTVRSGHFIQLEEPELVRGNIRLLLSKLP